MFTFQMRVYGQDCLIRVNELTRGYAPTQWDPGEPEEVIFEILDPNGELNEELLELIDSRSQCEIHEKAMQVAARLYEESLIDALE